MWCVLSIEWGSIVNLNCISHGKLIPFLTGFVMTYVVNSYRMKESDHRFLYCCLSSSEKGLNGDSNSDLCNASAGLYQLGYQANWEQAVMWVDYKPIDVEIVDDNTAIFHIFELWIGINKSDSRSFFNSYRSTSAIKMALRNKLSALDSRGAKKVQETFLNRVEINIIFSFFYNVVLMFSLPNSMTICWFSILLFSATPS